MLEFVVPFGLVVLALVLLVAEDILPTGGALGLLAVGCLLWLIYLGFSTSFVRGCQYLTLEAVLIPSGIWAWSTFMTRSGLGRIAFLQPPEAHEVDDSLDRPDLGRFVGHRGLALTTLRPSGMVDFEGRRLDGIAEEGLIPSGSSVEAVEVRSGRLIVRVSPSDHS